MPFNSTLTSDQLTAIRANGYSARQYLLFAPNTVVFQARVNQATFADAFAGVDFDTVTTGAYTAVKEGYTVYIGSTSDIRQASFVGYIRRDNAGVVATATSININQTSAAISDNWYIMVVRDVRLWYKLPRYINDSTYYKDYSIQFRRVRPLVTGVQSCYAKVLSSGIADFAFTPSASAVDVDATSTFTWAWDADGGAFQAGSSSTQNVTLRYATAGHYMPRVTITDSNGVTNWLTCHVFVVPDTYATVVETGVDGAGIERNIDVGNSITISAFEGVDALPDYNFCAVWSPDNLSTTYGTDIQFVGRLRNEQMDSNRDPLATYLPRTSFQVEGIGAELGRLFNAGKLELKNVTSPNRFDEIEKLTPLRGLGYYLSEHTTVTNISALTLDDLTNTYLIASYTVDQSSALDQCTRLLATTNRVFEYAPSGEIRTTRKAWYQPTAERNALTVVANLTTRDMQVDIGGGVMYSVSADMVNTVGRLTASGGSYTEATGNYQPYQAYTPSVAPTDGDDSGALNEQVLTANASGSDELGGRCANAFAEAQPPTLITVQLLPAYSRLIPSVNQWYTFTVSAETNNRGVTYSTSERWTLQSLSVQNDSATGFPNVTGVFRLETVGLGYQVVVYIPPNATEYTNPVFPLTPPYPNLGSDPTIYYPDPDNVPLDEMPPFTREDVTDVSRPNDPGTNQDQLQQTGLVGMAWASTTAYYVTQLSTTANFADITPTNLDGLSIIDGKPSKQDNKGYLLATDANAVSKFFRTNALGSVDYAQTELVGDYRLIRTTSTSGTLACLSNSPEWFETFDFIVSNSATYWATCERPVGIATSPATSYTLGSGWGNGVAGANPSRRWEQADIKSALFADTYIKTIVVYITLTAGTGGGFLNTSSWGDYELNGVTTNFVGPTVIGTSAGNYTRTFTTNTNMDRIRIQINGYDRTGGADPGGSSYITKVVINGTGVNPFSGVGGQVQTIYSSDNGSSFASPVNAGDGTSALGGFDTQVVGSLMFASQNGKVRQATSGGAYSDSTGGTTTGTYPICIVAYGASGTKYIMTTPAGVSGESVWKVDGGTPIAITPNDGVSDGLGISANCIAMADGIETHIVGIFSFGGTRKIAYSINGGSAWSFNTQVSNSASYIRMIRIGTLYYIAVCDADTLWWGVWDGAGTLTLYAKTAPLALGGFEFR